MSKTTGKKEAIEAVALSNAAWILKAETALMPHLERLGVGKKITTDDVWRVLAEKRVGYPREPRAMGALMTNLHKGGYIEPLRQWVESTRRECHSRPVRVWLT